MMLFSSTSPVNHHKKSFLKGNLEIVLFAFLAGVIYVLLAMFVLMAPVPRENIYKSSIDWFLYIFCNFFIVIKLMDIVREKGYRIRKKWKLDLLYFAALVTGICVATFISIFIALSLLGRTFEYPRHVLLGGSRSMVILFYGLPALIIYLRKDILEKKLKAKEIYLIKIKRAKAIAELETLQSKINPHFLYNSLSSITGFIPTNPSTAKDMVGHLSRFLDYSMSSQQDFYATVKEEISIVQTYLEIELLRFGDRLSIRYEVDPSTQNLLIPRFLLQPLVENAVKHGISQNTGEGQIGVYAELTGTGILKLSVLDSGPAFPEDFIYGYGLKNIYEKLELLASGNHSIHFSNEPRKGVTITFPKKLLKEQLLYAAHEAIHIKPEIR